jgi:hypothetical protein
MVWSMTVSVAATNMKTARKEKRAQQRDKANVTPTQPVGRHLPFGKSTEQLSVYSRKSP